MAARCLIYGVGPIVAATIIGHVSDVRRYPPGTTSPPPTDRTHPGILGRTVRHRLNRGGNRQLNRALYTIAITQIRADTEGRAYYQRKRAEGKTRPRSPPLPHWGSIEVAARYWA